MLEVMPFLRPASVEALLRSCDGSVERGTPFTWAALLLTNGIGPPGLLLYVLLSVVTGNGLPSLGYSASAKE